MSDHVYKHIELTGSSPHGVEDAVNNALEKARETLHGMRWFEVTDMRGHLEDGRVGHWQVTLKVGLSLD
ncbi:MULTISPECIES: dodecin [Chromohalobacter]|jgi:flavin-binding protein dodecin|uniref:Dodecin domain-containing protein n=1 Tax=Chromohalobacter israelensis (strain ATCC BAA-138 / DSM 3043 / CIP 106854 / NCIMB 13768 / 1H11) TaxID=290398 RepID=Q1QTJ1_CHRI1|nr:MULTISPECIES: dodecin [Chromohalobacter]ABE60217.1 protein of unknown function DUF1458 [Chromohalobacter salexigens DSM 3043]MBZ5876819.1 dodecin family protein [Chromohalobacter salexigens]MDF9434230.1 dodecin family protein [Chromohalobacter israelensis]MDO0946081.1 dodecin family protein [Chromohalobacter salexigens]NQY45183.1 dodecin domain-containing protein [Chromohalobacter sp.]